jgi:hypothetical protein
MSTKVKLPLIGRTFDRTMGCWNCRHRATPEESLHRWRTVDRPKIEVPIAQQKAAILDAARGVADVAGAVRRAGTPVNAPCPCGSGRRYKQCHRTPDGAAGPVLAKIRQVEMAVAHLEMFEGALQAPHPMLGQQGLCTNLRAPEGGGYKAHNFLCNEWSAAQGASVAREGQKADDLPGDLYAKHGDGN